MFRFVIKLFQFIIYNFSLLSISFFKSKKLNVFFEININRLKSWIIGYCIICENFTKFRNFNNNFREEINCSRCNSFNRQRQLYLAIKKNLGISQNINLKKLNIHNTESYGAVHSKLKEVCFNYSYSEYYKSEKKFVNNIRNENLENLSFQNNSIDLFITSDVFEHLPNPYKGFEEIHRVLKPSGFHIFTVPFNSDSYKDNKKAEIINGEIKYYSEPEYHLDGMNKEGALVFNVFGKEMLSNLNKIGFQTITEKFYIPFFGIIGSGNIVFVSKKND